MRFRKKDLLAKLKDIHASALGNCVAYAYGKKDNEPHKFFAIKGKTKTKDPKPKYFDMVVKIIGDNPTFCGYEYAFTILAPGIPKVLTNNETKKSFYEILEHRNYIIGYKMIGKPYFKDEVHVFPIDYSNEDNRYFTCAEKKIVGYYIREFGKTIVNVIYTTKAPCYHCLSVIKSAYYLTDDSTDVKHVERNTSSYSKINGTTVFDYTKGHF